MADLRHSPMREYILHLINGRKINWFMCVRFAPLALTLSFFKNSKDNACNGR